MDGNGAQFVKMLWIGLDLGEGHHLNPRRHRGGGDAPLPLGFSENNSRTDSHEIWYRYLSFEQFHTFRENFKSIPTMTFDL